jgi:hypothetical protein
MRGEWKAGKPFHWDYWASTKESYGKRRQTRSFKTKSEAIAYGKKMKKSRKWVQADLMDWSNIILMKKVGQIGVSGRYAKRYV